MERLLTVKEVAAKLRVSPTVVRKMARQGRIPCVEVGTGEMRRCYRFNEHALEEWSRQGSQKLDKQ